MLCYAIEGFDVLDAVPPYECELVRARLLRPDAFPSAVAQNRDTYEQGEERRP